MDTKTYEVTAETTEWDDILIKKGITTKENVLLAKGLNPLDVSVTYIWNYLVSYKYKVHGKRRSPNSRGSH